MDIDQSTPDQLKALENELNRAHQQLIAKQLNLDLTRGKPSANQLDLCNDLDGILDGNYRSESGIDTRNYGALRGLIEARKLGSELLELPEENVIAGGSSSLQLMFMTMLFMYHYGYQGADTAWKNLQHPKVLCPVPGYDRHFGICESLGIEMINVSMLSTGPDMDEVEALMEADKEVVGIWCVPKYANPTGCVYSDQTVERLAKLAVRAHPGFRIFWDNAYAVHDLVENAKPLKSLWQACVDQGTEDSAWYFASTSKISFAGAGLSWVGSSPANIKALESMLQMGIICFDQVNQLRHVRRFPDLASIQAQMARHRALLAPKFDTVLEKLDAELSLEYGSWNRPEGGYFISFDTQPGLASEVVKLAGEAGVKLTPAGATFPYRRDPQNRNIRLAPTLPPMAELEMATQVFVTCVKLATVRQKLDLL